MDEIVIVSAVRTPIGRYGGALGDVQAPDLAALVLREAVSRIGLEPSRVDEVVMGHVLVNGEAPNVSRQAVLLADFPIETPAYCVERQCGSGLQAICDGMMQIQTGNGRIVVAGGVESMSNMEYYVTGARWGLRLNSVPFYDRWERAVETMSTERFGRIPGMIFTAENVAQQCGITREAQDEFALLSQQRARAAIKDGKFTNEIVPVAVPQKKGAPRIVDRDEHPRPETTLESLAKLKPVLAGGTVTAGNASGMNDGAAACVLMSERTADELGLEPLGYLRAWAAGAVHPGYMGLGPVPAVKRLIEKTGLRLGDIDLIELNEAFAAQALGVLKELGISDFSNVNVNGSGIALGHPVGATGVRIMATLLYEMKRRGVRYGLETMCIGGGQGMAALVERK
ncbi:MAG: acetyl-CoA C-acyltransferase [Chloroflexota bacterium]|nr:MAG: acetyl-CoA C-acyltransferase [Chloroflexota bacterium]